MIFTNSTILKRQKITAEALGSQSPVIIVGSGEPISKPGGLDQTYPFLPHPEYYWLSGSRRSGGFMVYEPNKGWTHFVRQVDAGEKLWEGDVQVPEGKDAAGLGEYLKIYQGQPIAVLGSLSDVPYALSAMNRELNQQMRERLDPLRRLKDSAEMELVQRAVQATQAGFQRVREVIKPGITERQIQIELEAEMMRKGASGTSFGTIVGAGTHAAILHFEPSERKVEAQDLILVDAGAEVYEYSADVSRVFSAQGRLTPEQQAIYDLVLASQLKAISLCRKNREWHEVHRAAATVLAQGLKDLAILRGTVEELLDTGAIALFFPHGIGHMLGLRVRDVGGKAPGRPEGQMCCGARVRVDLPLQEGFLMTVEPGLYFVPAILDDPERRTQFQKYVNWEGLDPWRSVGGVRIEDDIFITAEEPLVLTAGIPK